MYHDVFMLVKKYDKKYGVFIGYFAILLSLSATFSDQ